MKRRDVYRVCVFLAAIGLALMYFSSLYLKLEEVEVGEIKRSWTGKNVKVTGNVTGFSRSGGHAFFDLGDETGKIKVVDFDSGLQLEQGETVTVTGHVEIYRGELEVIAKEVTKS